MELSNLQRWGPIMAEYSEKLLAGETFPDPIDFPTEQILQRFRVLHGRVGAVCRSTAGSVLPAYLLSALESRSSGNGTPF